MSMPGSERPRPPTNPASEKPKPDKPYDGFLTFGDGWRFGWGFGLSFGIVISIILPILLGAIACVLTVIGGGAIGSLLGN